MGWVTGTSSSNIEDRCRDLEHRLNGRSDAGKLWEQMHKIGRVVNNNAPKLGPYLYTACEGIRTPPFD